MNLAFTNKGLSKSGSKGTGLKILQGFFNRYTSIIDVLKIVFK